MKHLPRKRFGQHFLTDGAIIDAIVQAIAPQPGEPMVEIGPGLAALTQPLVERLGRLTVIELDRDLALRLRLHGQLDVIESDVLKVDFTQVAHALGATKIRVVGNLPYRLSVMLQWRYAMDNVLFVPPQSFDPPPRVDSAVVRMVPRAAPVALQPKLLEELVQVAFSQRRKILRNTLGRWLEVRGFAGSFDVQRRAEEVSVDEFVALAAGLSPPV